MRPPVFAVKPGMKTRFFTSAERVKLGMPWSSSAKASALKCSRSTTNLVASSVEAVLKRMELGQRLGVSATPTNFANDEIVPFGNREVWEKRIQAIISANGQPENAAEIRLDPTPTPAAKETKKPGASKPTP